MLWGSSNSYVITHTITMHAITMNITPYSTTFLYQLWELSIICGLHHVLHDPQLSVELDWFFRFKLDTTSSSESLFSRYTCSISYIPLACITQFTLHGQVISLFFLKNGPFSHAKIKEAHVRNLEIAVQAVWYQRHQTSLTPMYDVTCIKDILYTWTNM